MYSNPGCSLSHINKQGMCGTEHTMMLFQSDHRRSLAGMVWVFPIHGTHVQPDVISDTDDVDIKNGCFIKGTAPLRSYTFISCQKKVCLWSIIECYLVSLDNMTATQPPYYTTNFDTNSLSTTPTTTTVPVSSIVGQEATTADPHTGPAPTTAGPHHTDMANKLDPRVDSNLNNRAQYAPGTTLSGNVHPGATQQVTNTETSNEGPHSSALYNKLDPRVDSKTGNMTTKTTNHGGSGATRAPTDTTGAGVSHGSSTGAAGAPGVQDTTRSEYDPTGTGYNPSTGQGYSQSGGFSGQDYRGAYAPSTVDKGSGGSLEPTDSKGSTGSSGRTSDKLGKGLQSTIAGIHVSYSPLKLVDRIDSWKGTGESLRGTLTSAIDKAFDHEEGAAKNEAIATEGEREIATGNLSHHRSERK